ncbi:MAG: PH domain-containing protein [Halosimplex sp.]
MTDPRDDGDGADPPADGATADGESPPDDSPSGVADPPSTATDATDAPSSGRSPGPAGPRSTDASDGGSDAEVDGADGEAVDRDEFAAAVETPGDPRQLDPKVRYEWIVAPLSGTAVLAVGAAALAWFVLFRFLPFDRTTSAVGAGAVVFVLLSLYGVVRTVYLYRSWRYVVRDESLYLTRGVFTRVQTVVPYVRVQHIDTRRSALERALGLSTLVVYTAGSRGADVTIPGLLPDTAEDLQHRLERLAIASEDEDAV